MVRLKDKNMKNSIAILSLSALVAASVQTASAGDREWATVGKVLTGVAAAHLIAHAFQPRPVPTVVYSPTPVYTVAPVFLQPAPVVIYSQPVCVAPAQIVVAPRFCPPPLLNVNFGFGYRSQHHRHCR